MSPDTDRGRLDAALRQKISKLFVEYAQTFGVSDLTEAHRSFEKNVDRVMDSHASRIGGDLVKIESNTFGGDVLVDQTQPMSATFDKCTIRDNRFEDRTEPNSPPPLPPRDRHLRSIPRQVRRTDVQDS